MSGRILATDADAAAAATRLRLYDSAKCFDSSRAYAGLSPEGIILCFDVVLCCAQKMRNITQHRRMNAARQLKNKKKSFCTVNNRHEVCRNKLLLIHVYVVYNGKMR